ncbi:hypothetical protein WR25_25233 [Diploscapter pachys]|uniref:Uncharacterized protein n=1 Tax=Diploscapter pachys TaxID=2018661 RepID=A0A2A2KF86_9BILA|nr:hypothetical protein WR25_25233 [Diploscapter pachys]
MWSRSLNGGYTWEAFGPAGFLLHGLAHPRIAASLALSESGYRKLPWLASAIEHLVIGHEFLLGLIPQRFIQRLGGKVAPGGVQAQPLRALGLEDPDQLLHQVTGMTAPAGVGDDEQVIQPVEALHCQRAGGRVQLGKGDGLTLVVQQQVDPRVAGFEVGLEECTGSGEVIRLLVEHPVLVEEVRGGVQVVQVTGNDVHVVGSLSGCPAPLLWGQSCRIS